MLEEKKYQFIRVTQSFHKILCRGLEMKAILDHGPGSYSEQIQEKLNKSRIILKFYYYVLKINLMLN